MAENDIRCKKLCFFFSEHNSLNDGALRPFINWAIKLSSQGYEISILLLNSEAKLNFDSKSKNIKSKHVKSYKEIINYLSITRPDILISDDFFPRLRLMTKIRTKMHIKTCIYVQILFGFHIIADALNTTYLPMKQKLLFGLLRYGFFNFFKKWYKDMLQQHDLIITNSAISTTLLNIIYNTESHDVVYPPIDSSIFKTENLKKNNQVLVYAGRSTGDTDELFLRKILLCLRNKECEIFVLGNRILQDKLAREFNIQKLSEISDKDLARVYSESILTVCPQKWETFGYVIAESIFCGTPVLTFNCMGAAEIISLTKGGYLAYNKKDFLKKLEEFNLENFNFEILKKNKITGSFDISNSTEKLIDIIQVFWNQ